MVGLARGRALNVVPVVVVLLLAAACQLVSESSPPPPSDDEARAFLAQLVGLARAGDFVGLCERGSGNCEIVLQSAGRDALPADPPIVKRSELLPSVTDANGAEAVGGRILILCGTDRRGRPYRTEMLVFRDRGSLRAIEPVYWSGIGIGRGAPVTRPSLDPSVACQS